MLALRSSLTVGLVLLGGLGGAVVACGADRGTAVPETQLAGTEVEVPPGGGGVTPEPGAPKSPERAVAAKLGLPERFLVGMGNDVPGPEANYDVAKSAIYTLPVKLDIHYAYLSGLPGEGSWVDDNPGGKYVDMQANAAAKKGVVPMFTLYQMAARGEYNAESLVDVGFMTAYWRGAKLMFERLAAFDKPAIVHLEPDFWGGAQQQSKGGDPRTVPAKVGSIFAPCSELPDDVAGMGKCLVKLARSVAPKTVVGFQASTFGADKPEKVAKFLLAVGAGDADITVLETLDRDAGCFEAHVDPNCQRSDGAYYWDETNQRHPNFHDHLTWAKAIREGVGKPLLWWQMPFGVPSDGPGTAGKYRDNRVKYLFAHTDEFAAVGGIGAVFGVGAENQTTIFTDGGQFKNAVTRYYGAPTSLR